MKNIRPALLLTSYQRCNCTSPSLNMGSFLPGGSPGFGTYRCDLMAMSSDSKTENVGSTPTIGAMLCSIAAMQSPVKRKIARSNRARAACVSDSGPIVKRDYNCFARSSSGFESQWVHLALFSVGNPIVLAQAHVEGSTKGRYRTE